MAHHRIHRAVAVVAGAAALTLATATTASAHHCYKVDWNERAHENLVRGGSAWMPLSTVGGQVIAQDIGLPQCAGYAGVAVDHWMLETGTAVEPLIHSKATIGSGAYHKKGKAPKPIAYLTDADFVILEAGIGMAIDQCMADGHA